MIANQYKTTDFNFNSHAHVERDYSGFATGTNYQDFNSHAHVERDLQRTFCV